MVFLSNDGTTIRDPEEMSARRLLTDVNFLPGRFLLWNP
jgi:hypothetical protein